MGIVAPKASQVTKMFGRRTPTGAQGTDTSGRVSPRASPRGSYTGTGAFDRAQPSPPASPRYSSAGGVGTGTTGTGVGTGVGTGQQYGQTTTSSSPRYAQQTTTTAGYSGAGTGTGYSGTTGTGKVLSSSTDRGLAEFPGIGGTLAPIQHSERYPLAASERQYGGVVCNRQYFTVTEDRTVLRCESDRYRVWITAVV